MGCGGRAEEGGSSRPRAGMRLPEQEVSGEGAGQQSQGQRGGRDSSGLSRSRPDYCTQPEARRGWSGARAGAKAAAGLGAWLLSERGWPAGLSSVRGRAEPGPEGQQHLLLGWSSGESLMESVR